MGLKWLLCLTSPLFLGYENTQLVGNGLQIQISEPHNFQSSYEYAVHYRSEDSHGHEMFIEVHPVMSNVELRMLIIF